MHSWLEHNKRLIALLLLAVMTWVHLAKCLHAHHAPPHQHCSHAENMIAADEGNHSCSICEFQLARDAGFTGAIEYNFKTTCSRPGGILPLTDISISSFPLKETRGPPLT